MKRLAVAAAVFAWLMPGAANAALTQAELSAAGITLPANGALPQNVKVEESTGEWTTMGAITSGRPTLLLFADYKCRTLCGTLAGALTSKLSGLPLRPDKDYSVVIVGLRAPGDLRAAQAFREHAVQGTRLAQSGHFVSASPPDLARLTSAVGLRAPYDSERQQFAHPAVAILASSGGRLVRTLDVLALSPLDLRLSLAESSRPSARSLTDSVLLICYAWNASKGIYTPLTRRILFAACLATVFGILFMIVALLRLERRRSKASAGNG